MKVILSANLLENIGYVNFLEDVLAQDPEANFLVIGDLLNSFSTNKEYLTNSIFYELYGRLVVDEMEKITKAIFRFKKTSPFSKPLREMFSPVGEHQQKVQTMVVRRYERMFSKMQAILAQNTLYYLGGAMDYPEIINCITKGASCCCSLDNKVITIDGVKIAGISGIPNNARPMANILDLTPNEMVPAEYARKLNNILGVDILVTYVAPEQSKELRNFIKKSKVKLVICKAVDLVKKQEKFADNLDVSMIKNTKIIKVQPFSLANHQAVVLNITKGNIELDNIDIVNWSIGAKNSLE